jgi:hypothetical protein
MMALRSRGLAIIVTMLLTAGAAGAELALLGNYGNAEGCAYLKTNNIDSDELLYLTPKGLSSYGSGCDFVAVHADGYGNQLTQGICHSEGEEMLNAQSHVITLPNEAGAVRIYTATGDIWAELEPCS